MCCSQDILWVLPLWKHQKWMPFFGDSNSCHIKKTCGYRAKRRRRWTVVGVNRRSEKNMEKRRAGKQLMSRAHFTMCKTMGSVPITEKEVKKWILDGSKQASLCYILKEISFVSENREMPFYGYGALWPWGRSSNISASFRHFPLVQFRFADHVFLCDLGPSLENCSFYLRMTRSEDSLER